METSTMLRDTLVIVDGQALDGVVEIIYKYLSREVLSEQGFMPLLRGYGYDLVTLCFLDGVGQYWYQPLTVNESSSVIHTNGPLRGLGQLFLTTEPLTPATWAHMSELLSPLTVPHPALWPDEVVRSAHLRG